MLSLESLPGGATEQMEVRAVTSGASRLKRDEVEERGLVEVPEVSDLFTDSHFRECCLQAHIRWDAWRKGCALCSGSGQSNGWSAGR